MDFAPYQDTDPSRQRALSPPPAGSNRPTSPPIRNTARSPPLITSNLPPPNHFSDDRGFGGGGVGGGTVGGGDLERGRLDLFETSLPLRLDWEACLAYLVLPPAGGVFLLLVETRSDYVRCVGGVFSGGAWRRRREVNSIWPADSCGYIQIPRMAV